MTDDGDMIVAVSYDTGKAYVPLVDLVEAERRVDEAIGRVAFWKTAALLMPGVLLIAFLAYWTLT